MCPPSVLDAADRGVAPTALRTPPEFDHRFLRLRSWPLPVPKPAADSSACIPCRLMNEPFLAPVGLIQSASLLGRRCTGLSLKGNCSSSPPYSLTSWFFFTQLSSSAAFPDAFSPPIARSRRFPIASGTTQQSDDWQSFASPFRLRL